MAWLTTNWFWILIFIVFIGMHLFGHGGHGSHGGNHRKRDGNDNNKDEEENHPANGRSGGHQH